MRDWVRFLVIAFVTFVILAWTLFVPFYTVDDSHSFQKAQLRNEAVAKGNIGVFFNIHEQEGTRFYPGWGINMSARLAVFGTNAVLWHAAHLLGFALIGWTFAKLSFRVCSSIVPGVLAYAIGVFTTTSAYQSNAYNIYSTMTFEPLLLLQWSLGAGLLVRAFGGETPRAMPAAGAVFLLLWSVLTKETSGAIVAGALLMNLFVVWRGWMPVAPAARRGAMGTLAAVAALAIVWQLVVLGVLRQDTSYGGTGTLVRDPLEWLRAARIYAGQWMLASYLTIPAGLLIFATRTAVRLRSGVPADAMDRLQGMALAVGLLQLGTLLVWPARDMRLSLPVYSLCALAVCLEFWRLRTLFTGDAGRLRWWPLAVFAGALAMLHNTLPDPWGWRAVLGAGVVAGTALCVLAGRGAAGGGGPFRFRVELATLLALNALSVLLLTWTAWSNYRLVWRTIEGVRGDVAAYIAKNAPGGQRIFWVGPAENDIFAWSCARNVEALRHRSGLKIGPVSWAKELGGLRDRDWLVLYGGSLSAADAEQKPVYRAVAEGTVYPLERISDWHRAVRGLLSPHRWEEFRLKAVPRSAVVPIVELRVRSSSP